METKELNAEKYLELASNIYTQALEECKELLRSKGDKCYIYVTCEEKDNLIHLEGDGAMDLGWLVGVGLDGDNLLYCAYPYNDIPATIEDPWQVFDSGCYLSFESMPEVYSFIVGNLDKSVTKEEAVAIQEKDYDEHGLGQMPDFSFGWDSNDEDEDDDEDEDENEYEDIDSDFEEGGNYDELGVEYYEDGKRLVRCPKDYQGEFVVPEGVTAIDGEDEYYGEWYGAFAFCQGLTSIKIPNSVTEIAGGAFEHCTGLTSIEIPNGVTEIGSFTFYGCTSLTSIVIPNSVTEIGNKAFEGCIGLTSIEIPNSVTEIISDAFKGCTGLVKPLFNNHVFAYLPPQYIGRFSIPEGITKLASTAFNGCAGLTSVEIPNSVTSIGSSAFSGCSGLTSITIPDSVTSIGSSAFSGCSGLTSVEIPNSVTEIGGYAFKGCTGLTSVEIPNSIKKIRDFIFYGCTNLKELHIRHEHPEHIYIADDAFGETAENCTLYVPAGTDNVYRNHPAFGRFKEVVIEK